ncbi:MAG: iron-sulfur cluster assembly scaffold protein [Thermodesulfobacteriota bacterium]|nr:iron-sulfur cluster assembly scaffold protein [Thermodesulfobacteriota bacterium]
MMGKDFDDFVEGLQNKIYEETRATYGDVAFQRWLNPPHMGVIDKPDGYGRVTGPCGDTMEIFLKFENERVRDALFQTDGCGSSSVCGSFAAEMAIGRTPDEIIHITGDSILKKVGSLPKEDQHCAFLSADALQEALNDYMIRQQRS